MKIIPLRAFKDNYIWVFTENQNAWVVDPGDAAPVLDYLEKSNLNLAGILLTHHHSDHSGGIPVLLKNTKNISVYSGDRLKDNDEIICGTYRFKILSIPGHTLDHIAFFDGENLFCGDTLFSAGCGRVFEGTNEQMFQSLQKLQDLPDETKIFCGHEYTLANLQFAKKVEPNNLFIIEKIQQVQKQLSDHRPTLPSLLKDEKQMNPFLRCAEPTVIEAAEKQTGRKLTNSVEVFAAVREWKNQSI
jgi:hydroxyacylglutathione hydrolase